MKLLLLLIPLLFLSGCTCKTEYIDRVVEVKVPIEANVTKPTVEMRKSAGYAEKVIVIKKYSSDSMEKFK